VYAFAGASEQEGKVVLQGLRGKCEIMTTSKEAPRPKVTIKDAVDVNISPLLRWVDAKSTEVRFAIKREAEECRTPRRNAEVEGLVRFFEEVGQWGEQVHRYFSEEIFPIQVGHGLDVASANDRTVFVPVVPLFIRQQQEEKQGYGEGNYNGQTLVRVRVAGAPNMGQDNLGRFLDEHKRSMDEKLSELAKVFPEGVKLVTVAEANMLVATEQMQRLSHYVAAGLDYIEELLRRQLVAAIGKEVTAVDFAKYMTYHNSRIFREDYQPKPFCYAIRRPDHSPEGIISLEATLSDGSMAQPVATMVSVSDLNTPMQFAIAASAKVSFTGQVFVHGLMMHQFGEESAMELSLKARAKQFSSFLVLVGRIARPGLFDPQYGMICQNKDEITVPLEVETIPSAGEFKAATISISSEQQAFAKMYRGMQLASTLFAVCVIQIKPQLEKLLNLTEDSLTKEIRLTQDLLELFIQYQIPSDLLSYGGGSQDKEVRLESVKRNVRSVQLLIELEKLMEQIDALSESDKRKLEELAASAAAAEARAAQRARGAAAEEERRLAYADPTGTVTDGLGGRFVHNVHVSFDPITGFRGLPNEWQTLLQSSGISRKDEVQESLATLEVLSFCRMEPKREVEKLEPKKRALAATDRENASAEGDAISSPDASIVLTKTRHKVPVAADGKRFAPRRREVVLAGQVVRGGGKLKWNRSSRDSTVEKPAESVSSAESQSLPETQEVPSKPSRLPTNLNKLHELQKRRAEIATELLAIDEAKKRSEDAIVAFDGVKDAIVVGAEASVDYTKIPSDLDAALEKLDSEGALRPAIINVGKTWTKRSQKGLLGNPTNKSLAVTEQKLEKQACFDLLDGLTKSGSGAFGIDGAALHIVVSTTHCFEKNVMDTLVRDNVNPIAKVEHSALIVASRIFGKMAEDMVVESVRERIAGQSPMLFLK
jgi:hypothetical protein